MGPCRTLAALRSARWAVALCFAALTTGCAVPEGPELLQLSAASPTLLEPGGTLVVGGRGFPAGRPGAIELSGTRLVPGRDPERVSARVTGRAISSARLEATLADRETKALTGGAPHATFRGRLQVSFEPVRSGAPALRGHLESVTLDVLAPAAGQPAGSDFASYLGLGLGPDLSVVSVGEGLEGHAAGLVVGDRLHRLDGVRLLTLSDFAPRAHGRASVLEFSRPGFAGHAEVLLGRSDYFRSDPAVTWLALSVGLAALLGMLLAARPPRALVWLVQNGKQSARGPQRAHVPAWGALGVLARAVPSALVLELLRRVGASGWILDLPILAGASLGALLLGALLLDGRARSVRVSLGARSNASRFSLGLGLSGACLAALALAPVLLGWGLAAVEGGSLSLVELSASQERAPLGAGLLASPWSLISAITYLLALVPRGGEGAVAGKSERLAPLGLRALEEVGVGLALALWVVLYGGSTAHFSAPGLAALFWSTELFLLWTLLGFLRTRAGNVGRREAFGVLVWPVVLLSLLASGIRLLVLRFGLDAAWEAKLRWLPLLCLVSVCLWLALSVLRSLSHRGRRADPWL